MTIITFYRLYLSEFDPLSVTKLYNFIKIVAQYGISRKMVSRYFSWCREWRMIITNNAPVKNKLLIFHNVLDLNTLTQ